MRHKDTEGEGKRNIHKTVDNSGVEISLDTTLATGPRCLGRRKGSERVGEEAAETGMQSGDSEAKRDAGEQVKGDKGEISGTGG